MNLKFKIGAGIWILSSLYINTHAQKAEEMPTVWETKLDHKVNYAYSNFGGYSIAASEKEVTAIDSRTGTIKWNKKFKEIAPKLSKVDDAEPIWEANAVFFFDRKMGKDQVCVVDVATGNALWTSDKYQDLSSDNIIYINEKKSFLLSLDKAIVMVDAITGEEKWQLTRLKGLVGAYVYRGKDDSFVFLNARTPKMLEAFFVGETFAGWVNQIMKVKANNGEVVWENKYFGKPEKKIVTREKLFDLTEENDLVKLTLNGVQLYDYKTGKTVLSAAFDYTPERVKGVRFETGSCPSVFGRGAGARGVYGAVAEPIITSNDELFVMDAQKPKEQFVKKYDIKTGNLLWSSEDIKGAKVLPNMGATDSRVIIQIGGAVETQAKGSCTVRNSDGSVTYVSYASVVFDEVKPFGLKALDSKTGKLAWESERFKKGITNSYLNTSGNVIVCSGVAVYSLKAQDGVENFEVKLNKSAIGEATRVLNHQDKNIVVIGEKGLALHKESDGSEIISTKYKKSSFYKKEDDFVIMKTAKDDFAAFDLNTGNYKYYDARTGSMGLLSDDGNEFMVYEKKSVILLKTK
jgi:outer membrane protein assembly factor BamB